MKIKKGLGKASLVIALALVCTTGGAVLGSQLPNKEAKSSNLSLKVEDNKKDTANNTENKTDENKNKDSQENNDKNAENKTNESSSSKGENKSIQEVVKEVSPSVVTISVTSQDPYSFKEGRGVGSGFIISEDGYVATNYHVIENATDVKVVFSDGKQVQGKVVKADKANDVALVKVVEDVKMPGVAKVGNSDNIETGEEVLAIGNPLGEEFSGSVTRGIVSSAKRKIDLNGSGEATFIQTDTAINPGNSGGPLFNLKGEVIGINTAKKVGEEIEGMGFSIPINRAMDIIKNAPNVQNDQDSSNYANSQNGSQVSLGIKGQSVVNSNNKNQGGVYVAEVIEGSSAEKAGIKKGDVIVGLNGTRVNTIEELNAVKNTCSKGDKAVLTVVRDNQSGNLNIQF